MQDPGMITSMLSNQTSIQFVLPGLVIASTCLLLLLVASLTKSQHKHPISRYIAIGGLGTALYLSIQLAHSPTIQAGVPLFNHLLQLDPWAAFFHQLLIALMLIHLLIPPSPNQPSTADNLLDEALLLGGLFGAYGLVMANHWLAIYICLALMSTCSAVLIYTGPFYRKAVVPSFNYLFYQALASSLMLWGLSYLSSTGHLSIDLHTKSTALISPPSLIGLCLSLSGILLQLGVFPFHFWIADVYTQAPMRTVAYLVTIPKLAAIAVLTRIWHIYLPDKLYHTPIPSLIAGVAILTLLIGHLGALRQKHPRLILSYGAIAQGGLLLVGMLASGASTFPLTYYSLVYGVMNLAAWISLAGYGLETEEQEAAAYAGLGTQFPVLSMGLGMALLALIGLPPTGGFTSKLLIFTSLWTTAQATRNPLMAALWLIGWLGSILSLYYYLQIPYRLFFKSSPKPKSNYPIPPTTQIALVLLTILLLGVFLATQQLRSLLPTIPSLP